MVASARYPLRGEIWWADLDPTTGSEQAGKRPALIISASRFQRIQSRLVIIAPMTRTACGFPFHIEVSQGETGLTYLGVIMCDQIRTISTRRLLDTAPAGRVSVDTMSNVDDLIRALLDL